MRRTTVVLGTLDAIHRFGIVTALACRETVEVLTTDVPNEELSDTVGLCCPRVVLVDEPSADDRLLRSAISQYPRTRFIVFAFVPTSARVATLLALGADLLDKRASVEQIVTTLLLAGAREIGPSNLSRARLADAELTPRELEVHNLLLAEQSYQEIAERLGISPHTVAKHAQSIYAKLGIAGRRSLSRHGSLHVDSKRLNDALSLVTTNQKNG